jgi:putative ABC transport system permease protein
VPEADSPEASFRTVTPTYFSAMRIPILKGRVFDRRDGPDARRVVINQTLARMAFGEADPIGRTLRVEYGEWLDLEIVGVVGDIHSDGLREVPAPETYFPQATVPWYGNMNVAVRFSGDLSAEALRREILRFDPATPPRRVDDIERLIGQSVVRERASLVLAGFFAASAVLLTAMGVYGLLAYGVRVRASEIAVRMALGAHPRDIARGVLRQGLKLIGFGLPAGVAVAWLSVSYLETLLFGVAARDAASFLAASAAVLMVAGAGSILPAWAAARVDPARALRSE